MCCFQLVYLMGFTFYDKVKGINGVRRITIPKDSNIEIGKRVKVVIEEVEG